MKAIKSFLWSVKVKALHLLGLLSYGMRLKPSFIIIGTQKGGTSSLYYYLKFHPQVKRAIKKELHYFNLFYDKGSNWYMAHFPWKSDKHITGEASPGYLFHPEAAKRIKEHNPDMKLILLLRNPIERAYSAYQMNRRLGIDKRSSFEDAIKFELENKDIDSSYNYNRHNFFYLERGEYAKQLKHWSQFFDRKQMLIIKSDEFFKNTEEQLKIIYSFLEIDQVLPSSLKAMNVGKYPPLSEEVNLKLKNYFKKDLSILEKDWNIKL